MKHPLILRVFALVLMLALLICPAYAQESAVTAQGHLPAGNALQTPVVFFVDAAGNKTMAKVTPKMHAIGEMEYFFSAEVLPGWYNVVVSGICSGCPMFNTELAYIDENSEMLTIHPSRCTSEVIVLGKDGSPFVLGDGIYEYATTVCPDGYDIFSLSVLSKSEEEAKNAAEIRKAAGDGSFDFYEIGLTRQRSEGLTVIEDSTDVGLMTLLFDYDAAKMGKLTLWRYVNGKAEMLPEIEGEITAAGAGEEGYFISDDMLVLAVGKYGTYAIGYEQTVPATGAPAGVLGALVGIAAGK